MEDEVSMETLPVAMVNMPIPMETGDQKLVGNGGPRRHVSRDGVALAVAGHQFFILLFLSLR